MNVEKCHYTIIPFDARITFFWKWKIFPSSECFSMLLGESDLTCCLKLNIGLMSWWWWGSISIPSNDCLASNAYWTVYAGRVLKQGCNIVWLVSCERPLLWRGSAARGVFWAAKTCYASNAYMNISNLHFHGVGFAGLWFLQTNWSLHCANRKLATLDSSFVLPIVAIIIEIVAPIASVLFQNPRWSLVLQPNYLRVLWNLYYSSDMKDESNKRKKKCQIVENSSTSSAKSSGSA